VRGNLIASGRHLFLLPVSFLPLVLPREAEMSDSRWIRFELVKSYEKTSVWNVVAKDDGVILGSVFWCGPWRQYAFGPTADCATVYEQRCLRDIADFVDSESRVQDSIEARMGERKAARTAEGGEDG